MRRHFTDMRRLLTFVKRLFSEFPRPGNKMRRHFTDMRRLLTFVKRLFSGEKCLLSPCFPLFCFIDKYYEYDDFQVE